MNGDLGCFEVRGYAVNWLLRSDLGEVIKTIVADPAIARFATPKGGLPTRSVLREQELDRKLQSNSP